MYEDSDFTKPWFAIKYDRFGQLEVNTKYTNTYYMGQVTRETFLYWIHTCVEVDTTTATLRASVNGVSLKTIDHIQDLKPTPRLHLRLGLVHVSFYGYYNQFIGGVGNIKIFKHSSGIREVMTFPISCNELCFLFLKLKCISLFVKAFKDFFNCFLSWKRPYLVKRHSLVSRSYF